MRKIELVRNGVCILQFFTRIWAIIKRESNSWRGWAFSSVAFLIITQVLFSIPAPIRFFDAAWEAGDIITFVGTIVLGFVAWRQNARLLKVEEDTYVNSNGCIALIKSIEIRDSPVEGCEKQILVPPKMLEPQGNLEKGTCDIILVVSLSVDAPNVTLAHINSIDITLNAGNPLTDNKMWEIKALPLMGNYVRVGIGEDTIVFQVVIKQPSEDAYSLFSELKRTRAKVEDSLNVDIDLQLITQKGVMTRMKCQAYALKEYSSQTTFEFHPMYRKPITFWIEHKKVSQPQIKMYSTQSKKNRIEVITVKDDLGQ